MKYCKFGKTGIAVSQIALGTMYFGDETPEEKAFEILDAYVAAEGNLIDTADVYVGGRSEEIIGRWFASRPRDITEHVILASKGRSRTRVGPNGAGLSRRYLHRALDASLQRLGVDTIDLYQLHASDMHTPVEETLSFLDDAVRAGKIHYIGLSNFTGWQLQLMVSTAKVMGVQVPVSLQQQYSLLSRESDWEVLPAALYNDIVVLPWSPLAGGFLTGKYQRGGKPAADTRAGSKKDLYQWTSADYAASGQNWETIDAVVSIANEIGATPAQVALSWLIGRPGTVVPIIGARSVEQLKDSLGAADLSLSEDASKRLNLVSTPKAGEYPYGAFGAGQRNRALQDGNPAPGLPIAGGSAYPLGRV
ncbi:aldo/keto reductase [Cupriavidus metallidurans]|uniref:aldo/keto reductase n=1 Tax=Cupriavidus metallidurans TaxID=119219 RepID=UPI0005606988|nr:aldo/keto reductase [Cupriavidus metallidurans]